MLYYSKLFCCLNVAIKHKMMMHTSNNVRKNNVPGNQFKVAIQWKRSFLSEYENFVSQLSMTSLKKPAHKHTQYCLIIIMYSSISDLSVDSLQRRVQLILQVEERRSGRGLFDWVRQSNNTPIITKPLPSLQKSQTLTLQTITFVNKLQF